jgi:hypothetical protein
MADFLGNLSVKGRKSDTDIAGFASLSLRCLLAPIPRDIGATLEGIDSADVAVFIAWTGAVKKDSASRR